MTTDYTNSKAELHRVTTGAATYQFVIRNDDGWTDWAYCTVNAGRFRGLPRYRRPAWSEAR